MKRLMDDVGGDPDEVEQFLREAAIWGQLRHPCIVQFLGITLFNEYQSPLGVVQVRAGARCVCVRAPVRVCLYGRARTTTEPQEYVSGGSLFDRLYRNPAAYVEPHPTCVGFARTIANVYFILARYTWAFVKKVALDVASGGTFLHSQRVVHRDIKSPNVLLLTHEGRAKLTDFGIARWCGGGDDGENRCMTQGVGTIVWSAPELLMGEAHTEKVVRCARRTCACAWLGIVEQSACRRRISTPSA